MIYVSLSRGQLAKVGRGGKLGVLIAGVPREGSGYAVLSSIHVRTNTGGIKRILGIILVLLVPQIAAVHTIA